MLLSIGIAACLATGIYYSGTDAPAAAPTSAAVYQQELDSALQRYRTHTEEQKASLIDRAEEDCPLKVELLFYGACGENTLAELLDALDGSTVRPRFFLTALEASSYSRMEAMAAGAGCEVGVFNDGSSTDLTNVSAETALGNLSRASTAMQAAYGIQPSSMLLLDQPEGELLYAARAAYIDRVYLAGETAELSEVNSPEAAEALIKGMQRGELLALRLSSGATAQNLSFILDALSGTDLDASASALLAEPLTETAEPVRSVHTIERAVAFTFSGLGSDEELTDVLDALTDTGATATFFFTAGELEAAPERLERIIDGGHTPGISIETSANDTERELLKRILLTRELLTDACGYDGEMPVREKSGRASETLCAAAAAGGFTVISEDLTATRTADARAADAASVLADIMPESWGALRRGEIVHFYLGIYQHDEMLGELVTQLARSRCVYTVRPIMDILGSTEQLYSYPVAQGDMLPAVRDAIRPGQLNGDAFNEIRRRYIGIDWVSNTYFMPGFTQDEINKLDTTGLIANDENMVFLTFDDWGTDATITKLLDILRLHNVKATFFVRTSVVELNPNLLRAIAAEGHAIGCHTDGHLPLSVLSDDGYSYSEISDADAEALRDDLVKSYKKLQSIIGDMAVDGQPALSRLFRPPTLAVGRLGLTTVFDCGFTYSVSGSYTTQDYEAKSADELASDLKWKTQSGAVLVMHMSDNSVYTADALDIYLTAMEQGSTKYSFARLTDVLDKGGRS